MEKQRLHAMFSINYKASPSYPKAFCSEDQWDYHLGSTEFGSLFQDWQLNYISSPLGYTITLLFQVQVI